MLLLGCCVLAAQEQQGSAPPNPAGDQKATTSPGTHPDNAIRSAQRELAHESNEAVGEEKDDHQEFKESPSVRWVASHTGLSLGATYWLLVLINFGVIAAAIIWAWQKNVPGMFRNRTESIRKNLEEARRASEDANRRLSDIEARLSRLDAEIAEMRKQAEAEAAVEEQRIREAAEQDRRKVIESAEQEIDAVAKAARRDLKSYAAALAVSLAEKRIQIDAKTDQALVGTFVRELGRNGGKEGR
jgi:F-type H+-transporting ATPase subunit b